MDLTKVPDGLTVFLRGRVDEMVEFTDEESGKVIEGARIIWEGDNKFVMFSNVTDKSQFFNGEDVVIGFARVRLKNKNQISLSDPYVVVRDGKAVYPKGAGNGATTASK